MLSKTELLYFKGEKQVSKSFEYKLKHSIMKKVDSFLKNELPLLQKTPILELLSIKSLGKAKVAGSIQPKAFFLDQMKVNLSSLVKTVVMKTSYQIQ
jgi:hypothetical protein